MWKNVEKPDEIVNTLIAYVNDKCQWACVPFITGGQGTCCVILKPYSNELVNETLVTEKIQLDKFDQILNPTGEVTVKMMDDFFRKMGTEFPMCAIGVIDGECELATGFVVHYNGSVILDYAEPDFFDKLDKVIEHITHHDGLLGFSLPLQNEA